MNLRHLPLPLLLVACQSTSPTVVEADVDRRAALFDALAALEGTWTGEMEGMELRHEFRVTSSGSAVRETMSPGQDHEMVNMYTLDGNSLVMTHYCAAGNQPHMRASALVDGRMNFAFDGVSDLKAADESYMGEMTLVFVDDSTLEQHWKSLTEGDVQHEMVFRLTRAN